MGSSSVGAALTRVASIALAVTAGGVLLFTALTNCGGGKRPAAAPTRPATPAPVSTEPGSVPLPTDTPTPSPAGTRTAGAGLRALAGTWAAEDDGRSNYFLFRTDGSGEWVAYGQRIWTGNVTPRGATTFDLSSPEPGERSESYWRITLTGGRTLLFAGNRQTYHRT